MPITTDHITPADFDGLDSDIENDGFTTEDSLDSDSIVIDMPEPGAIVALQQLSERLSSVQREYIKTKPKYKSKYYETGYPNDEYGVCTDVVGIALKNAGYNLMELVNEDIKNNKEKYDIEVIDKNIDFRRVKNLKIFFKNNSINLTTDINKIEEWQGGDIIIFKNHIGIVSDIRNKKGIPFIIHNQSPYQSNYEEDILETRNDIVGHYRMS